MKQDQNKPIYSQEEIERFKEGMLREQEKDTDFITHLLEVGSSLEFVIRTTAEDVVRDRCKYAYAEFNKMIYAFNNHHEKRESHIKQELIAEIKSKLPKWRVCSVQQNEESEYCTDVPYNEALSEVNEILDSV